MKSIPGIPDLVAADFGAMLTFTFDGVPETDGVTDCREADAALAADDDDDGGEDDAPGFADDADFAPVDEDGEALAKEDGLAGAEDGSFGEEDCFAEDEGEAFGEDDAFPEDDGFGEGAGEAAFFAEAPTAFTQTGREPARTAEEPGVTVAEPAAGQDVFGAFHVFIFGAETFLPCTLCTGTGFSCFTGGGTAFAAAGGACASKPATEHTARSSGIRSLRRRTAGPLLKRREENGLRIACPRRGLRREEKVRLLIV